MHANNAHFKTSAVDWLFYNNDLNSQRADRILTSKFYKNI